MGHWRKNVFSGLFGLTSKQNIKDVRHRPLVRRIPWWRHKMGTLSALLVFVTGIYRSPVDFPHKGQWREAHDDVRPVISPHKGQRRRAKMFSLICAWANETNSRDARDLGRHRAHHDVTVMFHVSLMCVSTKGWANGRDPGDLRRHSAHCDATVVHGYFASCGYRFHVMTFSWNEEDEDATLQIARFMGPIWGPPGADRTQVGPVLAPWTLLSLPFPKPH